MNSLILRMASQLLAMLLMLFSVFLLLRGHNEPGGGFIGALVATGAFALYALASSPQAARRALRFDTRSFIAVGLLIALGSAVFPLFLGLPFLTGVWGDIRLWSYKISLGTPVLFDIGVYLAVFGVTQTMLLAMAEE